MIFFIHLVQDLLKIDGKPWKLFKFLCILRGDLNYYYLLTFIPANPDAKGRYYRSPSLTITTYRLELLLDQISANFLLRYWGCIVINYRIELLKQLCGFMIHAPTLFNYFKIGRNDNPIMPSSLLISIRTPAWTAARIGFERVWLLADWTHNHCGDGHFRNQGEPKYYQQNELSEWHPSLTRNAGSSEHLLCGTRREPDRRWSCSRKRSARCAACDLLLGFMSVEEPGCFGRLRGSFAVFFSVR